MAWSHCVGPNGKVTGIEISAEYAEKARKAFDKCSVNNVEIIEGDALET